MAKILQTVTSILLIILFCADPIWSQNATVSIPDDVQDTSAEAPAWRTDLGDWSRNTLISGNLPNPPLKLSWERKIADKPLKFGFATVAEGMIVFGIGAEIMAVNLLDGKTLWSQKIGKLHGVTIEAEELIIRNRDSALLITYGNTFRAVDCFTGEILNSLELPLKPDRKIVHLELPGKEMYLGAVNEFSGESEILAYQPEIGKIFKVEDTSNLKFLLPCTSGIIWGTDSMVRISSAGVTGTVCSLAPSPYWCGNMDRAFGAVKYEDSSYFVCVNFQYGRMEWETELPESPDFYPVISKDKILFTSGGTRVYCLDSRKGSIIWVHQSPSRQRQTNGEDHSAPTIRIACDNNRTGVIGCGEYSLLDSGSGTLLQNESLPLSADSTLCGPWSVLVIQSRLFMTSQGPNGTFIHCYQGSPASSTFEKASLSAPSESENKRESQGLPDKTEN
ncbi:MAG: hypothetical protein CVV64_08245 [Candidatus Wallbacteria bacterium HGW-Wallbacteria-1]|jgi:hypothetical protein|uniref:Serine/threonine protein kinase n=1 Tax=Candidatus Wallbacteria bacterium HGW-Wallbacteria-1 TaxID=2013854 RepID=A0A2N1PR98_9BACT|nr:MAG: hypothetical protein CVV64_08245 [Candidatus Wallbacteria bacterium HGW-Wallbacteria-1]